MVFTDWLFKYNVIFFVNIGFTFNTNLIRKIYDYYIWLRLLKLVNFKSVSLRHTRCLPLLPQPASGFRDTRQCSQCVIAAARPTTVACRQVGRRSWSLAFIAFYCRVLFSLDWWVWCCETSVGDIGVVLYFIINML